MGLVWQGKFWKAFQEAYVKVEVSRKPIITKDQPSFNQRSGHRGTEIASGATDGKS